MYATHQAGRNEFEVFIVFMCLLTGFSQVFLAEAPSNISQTSPVFQTVWSWTLLIGSAVALLGIFWREAYVALVLEMSGLLALGGVTLVYSFIVMLSSAEAGSLVAIPITLAFALASCLRSWKIGRKVFIGKDRREAMLREMVQYKAVQAVEDARDEIGERKKDEEQ